MHGHHAFFSLEEDTILTLILTRERVYKDLHGALPDVDDVKGVLTRDNYEREWLRIEIGEWQKHVFLVVSDVRVSDHMRNFPIRQHKEISWSQC